MSSSEATHRRRQNGTHLKYFTRFPKSYCSHLFRVQRCSSFPLIIPDFRVSSFKVSRLKFQELRSIFVSQYPLYRPLKISPHSAKDIVQKGCQPRGHISAKHVDSSDNNTLIPHMRLLSVAVSSCRPSSTCTLKRASLQNLANFGPSSWDLRRPRLSASKLLCWPSLTPLLDFSNFVLPRDIWSHSTRLLIIWYFLSMLLVPVT